MSLLCVKLLLCLNLLSYPVRSQVLPTCTQQSDCSLQSYCSIYNLCYDCSYIDPSYCDALNSDCCSTQFLQQCSSNPYLCSVNPSPSPPPSQIQEDVMNPTLKFGCIVVGLSSVSYISIGVYRNKYIHQKKGKDIFPHIQFWESMYGLVKDGISFTYLVIKHRYDYQAL